MRREVVDAEQVVVATDQRQDVIDPAADVRLPHPQADLLVKHLDQWHRARRAPVDT